MTALLPIHMAATTQDEFLAVHRGPWYTHQEAGSWDGSDETVAKLSEVGKGIFRLRASSGAVEDLPGVAPASLAAMADGTAIGCDRSRLWKLPPGKTKPEFFCPAPPQPVRLAASPDGTRVLLATTTELFEVEVRKGGLKRLADLPFPPERGLFCFNSGAVACAANKGLAVLRPGETAPRVWLGALPGKVGPVAAPDEQSLFTVDRDLVRIRWE